jgi:hypothetical protein
MNIIYKDILSYTELEDLLIRELDTIRNLKKFCDHYNITKSQYIKLSQIRNKKNNKKYTDLVIKMLALFDYNISDKQYFRVVKYENSKPTGGE